MTYWIIAYAAILYALGSNRDREIREVAHVLAWQWGAILIAWMLNGYETAIGVAISIRVVAAIWLVHWLATKVAWRAGVATFGVLFAYGLVFFWPDWFGDTWINIAVFLQLATVAWGAWGDGFLRLAGSWNADRRDAADSGLRVSQAIEAGEGQGQ